jgi:hypothetical protein
MPGGAPQLKPYHFKPGQTGNPRGINDNERVEVQRLARGFGREALERLVEIMRTGRESNQILAAEALLNRGFGKPAQAVEVTGDIRSFVVELPRLPETVDQWLQTLPIQQPMKAIESE